MKVKIYHNSRCSKSRQTLDILKSKNCDIEIIEYLKTPMALKELKSVLNKLNYEPRDLIRKGEDIYKKENLSNTSLSNDLLMEKMILNPILIERPVVVFNDKAVVGRPPEKVLEIIWLDPKKKLNFLAKES